MDPNLKSLAIKELARRELERRGASRVPIPKEAIIQNDLPQLALDVAMSGQVGIPSQMTPSDIPGVVTDVASMAVGDVPRTIDRQPRQFLMGGIPGANAAQGANQSNPTGLIGMVEELTRSLKTGKKLRKDAYPSSEGILPKPKTVSGQLTGGILGAVVPGATGTALAKVPFLAKRGSNLAEEIETLTARVLQPPKAMTQEYTMAGLKAPVLEAPAEVITKSKTYSDLWKNLDTSIKDIFKTRMEKFKADNFDVGDEVLNPLRKKIAEISKPGSHYNRKEIKQFTDVLEEEEKFFNVNQPTPEQRGFVIKSGAESKIIHPEVGKFPFAGKSKKGALDVIRKNDFTNKYISSPEDTVIIEKPNKQVLSAYPKRTSSFTPKDILGPEQPQAAPSNKIKRIDAEIRKEELQDLTHKLLESKGVDGVTVSNPARKQALDLLRQGYREATIGGDPEIERINNLYEGLRDAKWLVSGHSDLAKRQIPESVIAKIAKIFQSKGQSVLTIDEVVNRGNLLENMTEKIEGLRRVIKNVKKP